MPIFLNSPTRARICSRKAGIGSVGVAVREPNS